MAQCIERRVPERKRCAVRRDGLAPQREAVSGGAFARNAKSRDGKVHQYDVASGELRKVQRRPSRSGTQIKELCRRAEFEQVGE